MNVQPQSSNQSLDDSLSNSSLHATLPADPLPVSAAIDLPQRLERYNATQLLVTLSQPEAIAAAAALPVDGVGLLRSEFMIVEALEQQHPQVWLEQGRQAELVQRIAERVRAFAAAFAPRPVFYRSLDWRSHEFLSLVDRTEPEPNPMLGLRGTYSYQIHPELFQMELAALRQVQQWGYSNVNLLLPFVRTVEEFVFCRQFVEQYGLRQQPQFQLWIMAEVPAVLFLMPDYVEAGVQGMSIGTNDLTQLLLGVDRDQLRMTTAFQQNHPAVLRAIQQLVQSAVQLGIPCVVCGEATAQHSEIIEPLVQWGVTGISVNLNQVAIVEQAIARAEKRLLLSIARDLQNHLE